MAGLFGLENFYGGDILSLIEISQMAEELGFDSISVTDHVVMGKNLHKYPFGKFPLPSEAPWYEPLSLLTMIASNTKKINLATAVLIAPLRNPALLAKNAATLDAISKGRLELGVGLGWQKEEFDTAVDNMSSLIEPIMIVFMGTMIGGLMIAMYSPIFNVGAIIGS